MFPQHQYVLTGVGGEIDLLPSTVEELVEGPPSRRANATLTACPNGNHLWCIGGEFFSEDGKAVSLILRVITSVCESYIATVLLQRRLPLFSRKGEYF